AGSNSVKFKSFWTYLLMFTLIGCNRYMWTAPNDWITKQQLESLPETEPHGTIFVFRNDISIFAKIDEEALFRTREFYDKYVVSFRLMPGEHELVYEYSGGGFTSRRVNLKIPIEKDRHTCIALYKDGNFVKNTEVVIPLNDCEAFYRDLFPRLWKLSIPR